MFIITNNKDVYLKYHEKFSIIYYEDVTLLEILKKCRDKVHLGHLILTHPLMGSVKPNETPYKSVILSKENNNLDIMSLNIIESAIEVTNKFLNDSRVKHWPENILEDFRVIDYGIITNAMKSIG